MANNTELEIIQLQNLLEKTLAEQDDILIVQDSENAKKIKLINLILSMVKDNEQPAEYRIYSSKKVQSILDSFEEYIRENVTGFDDRIAALEQNKATIKFVQELYDNLDEIKLEAADLEPLNEAIASKRDTNALIKSEELDYSAEEYKIHMKHLGQDILEAMTGETPVSIPKVPEGGWATEYIANKAITSAKLADLYRYKGNITEGHLNEILADGIYLLGTNVGGIPVHPDDYGDELRMLEVYRYGDNGSYIIQRVSYVNNDELRPVYERKGPLKRLHVLEFEALYMISDRFKVTNDLLGDSYTNRGNISAGSIYETMIEGSYFIKAGTVKNMPNNNNDFLVEIRRFGDKYIYTANEITNYSCAVYMSLLYYDSNHSLVSSEWFKINSLNKSKFDGKRIHIFGDGISFGIGASSLAKKSYTSLLGIKYGFVVANHSLSDATVGNYNDDILKKKSLLTQIDSASLETDSDYVLIFMGTEDFKLPKAEIGNIDDKKDTTFIGSLNLAIEKILSVNTGVKILLATPLFRGRINPGDGKDCDGYPVNDRFLFEYANAIKKVGEYNHIPVVDLFNECMINKYTHGFYLADGLYPNDEGHSLVADKIFDAMSRYY